MTTEAERFQQDLKMINRPDEWPCWPRLPLKRSNQGSGFPEIGILSVTLVDGHESVKPIVYLTSLFEGITPNTPTKEYQDYEAMLDDGWTVD